MMRVVRELRVGGYLEHIWGMGTGEMFIQSPVPSPQSLAPNSYHFSPAGTQHNTEAS